MNIAIVDDEQFYLDHLANTIEQALAGAGMPEITIDRFSDGASFFARWKPNLYQMIFLDIYMGEENGVDVARRIREQDEMVTLIFSTTSNEFAAQSYEVNAGYYLQKPITQDKISIMLQRVNLAEMKRQAVLELPDGHRCLLHQIQYTSYSNHIVTFHQNQAEPYSLYMSQRDAEDLLQANKLFCSVNRGNIVNLEWVAQLNKTMLVLKNGENLPISRGRYKDVSQAYLQFRFESMMDNLD